MTPHTPVRLVVLLSLIAGGALRLSAQTTTTTTTTVAPPATEPPAVAPAQVSATSSEAPVQLNPFEVTAGDKGWVASSTLSGNRTQEDLANVPITVFAMTGEFMKDLNLFTLEDASRWVAGIDVTSYSARRTDDTMTGYRGMASSGRAGNQSSRNFFDWFSPTDQYNIDRIDFNFGSNSLMYGDAQPGGLATTYTKVPQFHDFGEILVSYDNYGSHRAQLDFNRQITSKIAFRLNAVDRDTRSFIEFYHNGLRAIDGALIYKPFEHTTIRGEFESGLYRRIRDTDEDGLQPVAAAGKGYNTSGWYFTSDGTVINNSPTGTVAAVDKTGGSGTITPFLQGESVTATLPGGVTRVYKGFDKHINLLGTGDYVSRPYKNETYWLDQTFGKLALEASYNQEREVQQRNDTDFGGTGFGGDAGAQVNIDSAGRLYEDMATPNPKVYSEYQTAERVSVAYPFELGKWMTQYIVASFNDEVQNFDTTRYNMYNAAAISAANPLVTNNKINFRAYLDTPNPYSGQFWNQFSFNTQALPTSATFQPAYYFSSDPNAPWVDVRYNKTYAISTSGTYFNGKLHTLFGLRQDDFRRKRIVVQPNAANGSAIFLGGPNAVPQDYAYDPEFDVNHKTWQAGAVYDVFKTETNSLNVYADYSTSFDFQGFQKWDGPFLGPLLGQTREVGLKGETLSGFLTYTVGFYRQYKQNAQFSWSNPSGVTTTTLQTLFNPIGLSPTDPSYFTIATGNNSEATTVASNQKAKGVEVTFQLQRFHGFQILLNGDYNKLTAVRDFTDFQARLNAALARQAAYLAAGQAGYPQSIITGAQTLLANNLGISEVQGEMAKPEQANLLIDYAFSQDCFLNGLELGVGGNWQSKYDISVTAATGDRKGDSELPITVYGIYRRKIANFPTTFRIGVTNLADLENLHTPYRVVGIQTVPAPGVAGIYQYAYFLQPVITGSIAVDF